MSRVVFKKLLNTSHTEKAIQLKSRMLCLKISPGVTAKNCMFKVYFFDWFFNGIFGVCKYIYILPIGRIQKAHFILSAPIEKPLSQYNIVEIRVS